MKQLFEIKNNEAILKGESEPHADLSTSIDALGQWARKISTALKKDGPVKFIHQDHLGATAFRMDSALAGNGIHIEEAAVCHSNILNNL